MQNTSAYNKAVKASTPRFFGYYPNTVALVTAEHQGKRNVMSAGWHAALSSDPPLYGVAIGRERATHALVTSSGRFALNFLPFEHARAVQGAGVLSLHDGADKYGQLGLTPHPGEELVLAEAYLTYVCSLSQVVTTGDHDWCVGQVERVWYDEGAFDERLLFRGEAAVYLGRSEYVCLNTGGKRVVVPSEQFG